MEIGGITLESRGFQNLSCCGWPASLPALPGDECWVPGGKVGQGRDKTRIWPCVDGLSAGCSILFKGKVG